MNKQEAISAIDRFQNHKLCPGHFLRAVLSNDLMDAVNYGDKESLENLPDIARHIFSRVPANIYGSRERVAAHLQSR